MARLNFASTTKSVTCTFNNFIWHYKGETHRTCAIVNQSINDHGFYISTSIDSTLKGFSIQNNIKIEYLPENIAEKFPNLIYFQTSNCSVKVVKKIYFKNLEKLININLQHNSIEWLENQAFKDNVNLEKLELASNKINYLSENIFGSLKNLKVLHLHNNEIQFLAPKTFQNLENIKNISLTGNQLENIDENLLKNNKKLEWIWLDDNKIKSISYKIFDETSNLKYVDLRRNSCVDEFYYKSKFGKMKEDLKETCLTSAMIEKKLSENLQTCKINLTIKQSAIDECKKIVRFFKDKIIEN